MAKTDSEDVKFGIGIPIVSFEERFTTTEP